MASPTRLTTYRGDTLNLPISMVNTDTGEPQDITGWTFYFTLKSKIGNADADAEVKKDVSLHSNPTGGQTAIELTASDTANLLGQYTYDIEFLKPDGTVTTIVEDKITFLQSVTRRP